MNKQDKFLVRLASGLGIIISAWFWISTRTPYTFGRKILCDYNWVIAIFLGTIFIFYVMLVYAISRHIKIARSLHIHHTDEKMNQVNLSIAYYALLAEGIIISIVLLVTLISLLWFGRRCGVVNLMV